MNEHPPTVPATVAALDSEMIVLRRIALLMATIGGLVAATIGLIIIARDEETGVPHLAVQGVFVALSALAALRALFPGANAYRQAAILFCWAFTLGFGTRAVMGFVMAPSEWVEGGAMARFAVWATLPLIINFLFLPLRQALLLSLTFYVLVSAAVLYADSLTVGAGDLSPTLLGITLFFVFVGVPFSIGMLAFIVYGQQRYRQLSGRLEEKARQALQDSERDDVTDCLNRRGLMRRLEDMVATEQSVLAAIELDNITRHLQILGGTGAHMLLMQLGHLLREAAGPEAIVARWDGGRFYVYLPTRGESPLDAAARLFAVAADGALAGGTRNQVTLSVGACEVTPGSDISDYMEEADLRLFLAQSSGGNCIRFEAFTTPKKATRSLAS